MPIGYGILDIVMQGKSDLGVSSAGGPALFGLEVVLGGPLRRWTPRRMTVR
jgi:hypothetical protein